MSAPAVLRTAFRTSRALDFASVEELTRETGQPPELWPFVVIKELLDNALDACEEHGGAPEVTVAIDEGGITVTDNGPGIPAETVAGVVDLQSRVSSRSRYVAPDRGAQGNALKTIIAMPFVLDGAEGRVEVAARGRRHAITFALDELRERPEVTLATAADASVRTGTSVRVYWPSSASSLVSGGVAFLYRMATGYALVNPHLRLTLRYDGREFAWCPVEPAWTKWRPSRPTSSYWYTPERLAGLIAAYLAHDRDAGADRPRLVRDFLALFDGLTGTAKRKAVLDATGLHRAPLRALLGTGGLDMAAVARLLDAMKAESRLVRPDKLGLIGADALWTWFDRLKGDPDSFQYKRVTGTTSMGRPWIVEAAFGWLPRETRSRIYTGVNWSPALQSPFRGLRWSGDSLDSLLAGQMVASDSPVLVVVHLAMPGPSYTDRGKSALALPPDVGEAILSAVRSVCAKWAAHKKREERDRTAALRRKEALSAAAKPERITIKDAAWRFMREAYLKASANNTLPANARQIYYAARRAILALTGRTTLNDHYFTQKLVPRYVLDHPVETASWDVVFDARGHLIEPHTRREVALGTLEVRHYLGERPQTWLLPGTYVDSFTWPTAGPRHRFGALLFIEKEGFDPLIRASRIAERWDIAIMSTKGMSVIAARQIIDRWAAEYPEVKILVAHDFDVSGFSIFGTLGADTWRYEFKNAPNVIDIGLRLADVEEWGLQSEAVAYKGEWSKIAATLRRHRATEEEIEFLRGEESEEDGAGGDEDEHDWDDEDEEEGKKPKKPRVNRRVELNAFTSDQFIAWLESRLEEHGVAKVIPDGETLERAARAAWRLAARDALLAAHAEALDRQAAEAALPSDLYERVEALLAERPEMPWDEVIETIVANCVRGHQP